MALLVSPLAAVRAAVPSVAALRVQPMPPELRTGTDLLVPRALVPRAR